MPIDRHCGSRHSSRLRGPGHLVHWAVGTIDPPDPLVGSVELDDSSPRHRSTEGAENIVAPILRFAERFALPSMLAVREELAGRLPLVADANVPTVLVLDPLIDATLAGFAPQWLIDEIKQYFVDRNAYILTVIP